MYWDGFDLSYILGHRMELTEGWIYPVLLDRYVNLFGLPKHYPARGRLRPDKKEAKGKSDA